jgi:hypothetical protein
MNAMRGDVVALERTADIVTCSQRPLLILVRDMPLQGEWQKECELMLGGVVALERIGRHSILLLVSSTVIRGSPLQGM